jgi:cellulose synthase/poly-beta-1,6-N-acetylglucosamine synthase-like glycosyltransferase
MISTALTFPDVYFFLLFILTFAYMILLLYLKKGLRNKACINTDGLPDVSVIVSMHNEAFNAGSCLERLLSQNYPQEKLEIIAIDDRSVDDTGAIIRTYADRYTQIRLVSLNEMTSDFAPKKQAIDQAIRLARGEIILLTDADGRPPQNWVRQMVSCFKNKVGMVIGYAPYHTPPPGDKFIQRLLALEYLSQAAVAAASAGVDYPITCVGTNMAYRKKVFEQIGGFGKFKKIHSGDDDLLLQQIREKTDWKIVYNNHKDSFVWNAPPVNWHKFYHQRLRYASKGFLYPKKITAVLVSFYLLNLFFMLSPLFVFFDRIYLIAFLSAVMLKAVSEYNFMYRAAVFLSDQRYLYLFPVAFFLHIPYVLIFGFLAQIKSFEWGNRKS